MFCIGKVTQFIHDSRFFTHWILSKVNCLINTKTRQKQHKIIYIFYYAIENKNPTNSTIIKICEWMKHSHKYRVNCCSSHSLCILKCRKFYSRKPDNQHYQTLICFACENQIVVVRKKTSLFRPFITEITFILMTNCDFNRFLSQRFDCIWVVWFCRQNHTTYMWFVFCNDTHNFLAVVHICFHLAYVSCYLLVNRFFLFFFTNTNMFTFHVFVLQFHLKIHNTMLCHWPLKRC